MNIIKQLRKEKDLKQEYIAYKCGVTQQAVSRWERGTAKPSCEHLKILSEIFEYDFEKLVSEVIAFYKDTSKLDKMK